MTDFALSPIERARAELRRVGATVIREVLNPGVTSLYSLNLRIDVRASGLRYYDHLLEVRNFSYIPDA